MRIRKDGKTQLMLLLLAIFGGVIGSEYFYVKKNKLGLIKMGISLLSWTLMTLIYVIYASVEVPSDFNYNLAIVLPIVLSGIPTILMFLWSIFSTIQIAMGIFTDEFQVPINNWNAKPQDVANYLIKL